MTTTTPNMSLVLPDVLSTPGPQWATLLNAAYTLIDSHNHSSGQGVTITPAGLNISSDLSFVQNNATNLRSARLYNNVSISLGINDKTCLYSLNNELYYVDGAGNNVQVTLGGTLNLTGGISSLTINDSQFVLQYFGDTSRKFRFNASAIPSSTTRIFSLPDSGGNDTLVTQAATQTLTNKTLTGNTAANLISGAGQLIINTTGTITLPNVTDTVVGLAATQTLTNKVLTGNTVTNVKPDGVTVFTFPAVTDTAVGLAATQTLTNKTFTAPVQSSYEVFTEISTPSTPSAGTVSIYAKSDNNMYYLNSTGLEQQIGSGGGSGGGINYISNGSFENGTVSGWATYLNTAQSTPVTGTGGSPNVTFASTSSSPLRGTYSGLFTKAAVNYQGQGVSYAFTLSAADVSKTLQLTFDASASAALVSGDIGIYVYDITNSILITPSSINLPTGLSSQYSLAFQTTTSLSYRLIFHVATTNASAYTFSLDQITLSPVVRPMVAGESDWVSYTPTYSAGFGTVTNNNAQWKRVGDSIFISGSCTVGTAAGSIASITLPTSVVSINSSKLSLSNTTSNPGNILGTYGTSGVAQDGYVVSATGTSTALIYFAGLELGTTSLTPANGTTITTTGDVFTFSFSVPVSNWSSNITLASTTPMIEYVYNTSTSNATDTTSFGYGAAGTIGIFGQSGITQVNGKLVQFQNAIQPTDRIQLELSGDGKVFFPITATDAINGMSPFTYQNSGSYGMGLKTLDPALNQVYVYFGQYAQANGTTYGAAGSSWSGIANTYRWRVAKYSSIGGAELAPATSISTGTITRENVWTAYVPSVTGLGTVSANSSFYKVLGDSLFIRGSFTTGTAAAATASVTIPSGFTISAAKLSIGNTSGNPGNIVGGYGQAGGAGVCGYMLSATGTSTSIIYFGGTYGGNVILSPQLGNAVFNGSQITTFQFEVPLV